MDEPLPRLNMTVHSELMNVMNEIFSEEIEQLIIRLNKLYCMEGEMTDEWMNEISSIEETLNSIGVSY